MWRLVSNPPQFYLPTFLFYLNFLFTGIICKQSEHYLLWVHFHISNKTDIPPKLLSNNLFSKNVVRTSTYLYTSVIDKYGVLLKYSNKMYIWSIAKVLNLQNALQKYPIHQCFIWQITFWAPICLPKFCAIYMVLHRCMVYLSI